MTKLSIVSLCWTALAFAALAPAQETKQAPKAAATPKPGCCVQQVYQVKHVNVGDLYRLIFTRPEQGTTLDMPYSEQLKAISVYGTPQEVNSIMANLKALDVAATGRGAIASKAEITVWLVAASISNEDGADTLPSELHAAVKAVASSFGYRSFQLMDSAVSLIKAGSGFTVRGNATPPNPKLVSKTVAGYSFSCESVRIESIGEASNVNLDRFMFRIQVPYCTAADCSQTDRASIDMNGSFNIREGQKAVIGKSKMDGNTKDLILIVSAKVVD